MASKADRPGDISGPSLFTALREQLGMHLVSKKGPVKTWVIDKVEKPGRISLQLTARTSLCRSNTIRLQ